MAFGFTIEPGAGKVTTPVQAPLAESLGLHGSAQLYITFRTGSADLDPGADAVLTDLARVLRAQPDLNLALIGHTDDQGSDASNQRLSERRASAVKAWLVSAGIVASRLTADGRGEAEPIASNDTAEGRALNRRVEAVRQ